MFSHTYYIGITVLIFACDYQGWSYQLFYKSQSADCWGWFQFVKSRSASQTCWDHHDRLIISRHSNTVSYFLLFYKLIKPCIRCFLTVQQVWYWHIVDAAGDRHSRAIFSQHGHVCGTQAVLVRGDVGMLAIICLVVINEDPFGVSITVCY